MLILGACRIGQLLETKGMKQAELARRLKIHPQQLSRYILNIHIMPLPLAVNAAFILECAVEDLYEIIPGDATAISDNQVD